MKSPSLPELMMQFFSSQDHTHDMFTLLRMEEITETLTDGRFIMATAAAETIYGQKMDGSKPVWISLTQPLDLFLKSRRLWAARPLDVSLPTRYLTDLLLPSGELVPVLKDTKEFSIEGVRYWLTNIKPASEDPAVPHINDIEVKMDGLPHANMTGKMCLAEVLYRSSHMDSSMIPEVPDAEVRKKILTSSDNPTTISDVRDNSSTLESGMEIEAHTQAIIVTPSTTGKTQRPHFVHRCSECDGSWVGVTENPPKCNYCESRLWKGYSKWQVKPTKWR